MAMTMTTTAATTPSGATANFLALPPPAKATTFRYTFTSAPSFSGLGKDSIVLPPRQSLVICYLRKTSLHNMPLSPNFADSSWASRLFLNTPTTSSNRGGRQVACNSKGLSELKEQKWVHEGLITESLANGMFRVKLDNGDLIIGYISGRIRQSFIRVLPGDRVKIEVSRYDSSRGRITYRLRNTKDAPESKK